MKLHSRIVILDFTVESNRGDAALQVGLLNLVKKYFDQPHITVISVVGSNQVEHLDDAHDHTAAMAVDLIGGIKPTYYPFAEMERPTLIVEVLNAFAVAVSAFPLALAFAGLSVHVLAYLYPPEFRKALYAIHEADFVLWNRRNLRSRRFHLLEIYRTFNLLFHPLLAIAFRKPMAVAGSSLWELSSPISQAIVKFVLERFFFISFREENSFLAGRKLLFRVDSERIKLLPDLSFAAFDKLDKLVANRKTLSPLESPQEIGITLVDWTGDGMEARERYIGTILETIRHFIKLGSRFIIIPQVTKKWEGFGRILKEIQEKLDPQEINNLEIIEGKPSIDDLLKIYSRLDFLIATRMHSAIFALAVQTPVAAISYDSGGKWSVLSGLGYADHVISYEQITAQKLIGKVVEIWRDKDPIMKSVRQKVMESIRDVDFNVSLLADYFSDDFRQGK